MDLDLYFDLCFEWEFDEFTFNPVWYWMAVNSGYDLSNEL
jgi:hypothetical protein